MRSVGGAALTAAGLLLACGAPALAPGHAAAASGTPSPAPTASSASAPTVQFRLKSHSVPESSGLARSVKHPGVWWTINDSGSAPKVYAFNATGRLVTVLSFDAPVQDTEAIAVTAAGKILVADCGDNTSRRSSFTVYEFDEPSTLTSRQVSYHAYDFAYPDGAHDAETMLVQPSTGRMYFATKASPGALYSAPPAPSRTGTNQLTKVVSTLPTLLTDGVFAPDGKTIYLRTYTTAYAYSWPQMKVLGTEALPLTDNGAAVQGESLALAGTPGALLAGAEGNFSPVYRIAVPESATAPSNPSTTPASVPPSGATQSAGDDPLAGTETPKTPWYRDAKVLTIGGAAVFALLIMAITVPIGRGERQDAAMEQLRRRPRRH